MAFRYLECYTNFKMENNKRRIAILGGGPSGMFMFKRLIESGHDDIEITIFEKKKQLGAGMPYSNEGSNDEHITNVSANEIPALVTSIADWIQTIPDETLGRYDIERKKFNEYKVLPRLLFGAYLSAQFELLLKNARSAGISVDLHTESEVVDVIDKPNSDEVWVKTSDESTSKFDRVIICTGHNWPKKHEGKIPGYFDSPYPPAKLQSVFNHAVAIRGSSLTAIDAIRTMARNHGNYTYENGNLTYKIHKENPDFRIVMHSRNGLLPAVRFHLEDTHLQNDSLLTDEQIDKHKAENGGFLSLDFIFENDFKAPFLEKDPAFYDRIRNWSIEEFVSEMMKLRERLDPFMLLKAEYAEAEKSIRREQSVYWKEMLAVLSFAMNYPAKYLSAEDMLRLQKVLMPLISIVIAFVPQGSCREMLALHAAGLLDLVAVGDDSQIEPLDEGGIIYKFEVQESGEKRSVYYPTFIDCVGQPHLSYMDFPFKSLIRDKIISPATLRFRSPEHGKKASTADNLKVEHDTHDHYYLHVQGIAITDHFQVADRYGAYNPRIYIMAVPYIGGYNPDYSGLDFCEAASAKIIESLF